MDISGIAGVIIWTDPSRHAEMARFYRDVVGLTPRSQRDGFINFEFGEIRLTIARHSELSGRSQDPKRIMVNLRTERIEETYRRMSAAGAEFVRLPEREPWGGSIATFHDPDGNVVQLLQPE